MATEFDNFQRSFDAAQQLFGDGIDTTDRSRLIVAGNAQEAQDYFTNRGLEAGFYPVEIDSDLLLAQPDLYVNRALLMHSPELDALCPVIITQDQAGGFLITKFNQPYDPAVGFSSGMHWNVSVEAQTRTPGFGGHGARASGLEQGHFGATIVGASNKTVARAIVLRGDKGTHGAVVDRGVAETMGDEGMLPVALKTKHLPIKSYRLMAYWHDRMRDISGRPISGDFPEATRIMLGAGIYAVGQSGLARAEVLVKEAVRGA